MIIVLDIKEKIPVLNAVQIISENMKLCHNISDYLNNLPSDYRLN
jgi:hypothetical protein